MKLEFVRKDIRLRTFILHNIVIVNGQLITYLVMFLIRN